MDIYTEKFDSINQLLGVIGSRPNNKDMYGEHASTREETDAKFSGTNTWDEAIDLFRNGYEKPLKNIKYGVERNLKVMRNRPRRTPKNSVVGYIPNVPNYLIGIPEQMINIEKKAEKTKTVNILYSVSAHCGVKPKELEKAGIAILTAINKLELSGVRVELDICAMAVFNHADTEAQICLVKLKDYREHLDIKKLCFPLAHSAMLRRIGFKWLETTETIKIGGFSGGYGRPAKTQEEQRIHDKLLRDGDLFITFDHVQNLDYDSDEILKLIKP